MTKAYTENALITDDEDVQPPEGVEIHSSEEEAHLFDLSNAPVMVLTAAFASITGREFAPGWYFIRGWYDAEGEADFDDDGPVNGPYPDMASAMKAAGVPMN